MKTIFTILVILNSLVVLGQNEFKGTVKTYEDSLELPFALICIDTIDTFKGFTVHIPIDSTNSDKQGNFSITTNYPEKLNLIISFMDYVPLTIKNIEIENNTVIDLGNIYLPNRGQLVEGYRPPEGETKTEARKREKKWKKSNELVPTNWAGFSPDFFDSYRDKDTIQLEYPLNGTLKKFQIKQESLIIDYKEFIKK